jgi:hypothetical protein
LDISSMPASASVAEGRAEPIDPEAGLPEAGIEEGFTLEPEGESGDLDRPAN